MADMNKRKKYHLGAAIDKEIVFDFPYILHEDTLSYIQEHGKIMFIIRGPPSTGKATLSEMICEKYGGATLCCADHFFKNTFNSPVRNRETIKASHVYCAKKAESACKRKVSTIIIQNTHMRKWEMQSYLDFAAYYNYTVIMAITLYRFNVTPEALVANSTDGLDLKYFQMRLVQWEDVPPYLTGWFLGPNDTSYLKTAAFESLQKLIGDGKFCRVFNSFDSDEITEYFTVRDVFCCLAGYSTDKPSMKNYYLSPDVQDVYGKCFKIIIVGYHVTPSNLIAIVQLNDEMKSLLFEDDQQSATTEQDAESPPDILNQMSRLECSYENLFEFRRMHKYFQEIPKNYTACTEDWDNGEEIDILKCSFIHLAQRDQEIFDIGNIREEFKNSLSSAVDNNNKINNASFIELESDMKIFRLKDNEWLIKADKKIIIKTIFTGFYP